jgi:hypothetical protein
VSDEQKHIAWEGAAEPAPRFHGGADDEKLRAALGGGVGHLLRKAPGAGTDDLLPHGDAVGARDRDCRLDSPLEVSENVVHARVQRQLAIDDERRDEDDAGATVGGEPARQVERVLGLLAVEQRHDDAPVGDRARPACETASPTVEQLHLGWLHRSSW